ncbi:cardiolipin synthase [Muriicola jejuensis]|uniref:Cardiolipin synthase n=1 Tax=Muriicola jejuensis TaxID=504488 RepID=A0A6P0U7J0_9FLAO|nr:cardiolipin synthase [Muriicola jejuensis]NER09097.1 cardiolipin synthase [Muriicola jejuensis]SMP11152.1 cardiolipin synthase [Muriicola jejuensis]
MLEIALIILYILIALSLVIGLLINGVKPSKTLAWLLAIFTIPVGGILLYIMLGRNRRKKKLSQMREGILEVPSYSMDPALEQMHRKYRKLMTLVESASHYPPTDDNVVTLLEDGKQAFHNIFQALEDAEDYIYLQYYIFEEGELTDKLLSLFEKKKKKGVDIKLIYDGIGSYSLSSSYIKRLKSMGVEVFPFLPFRFGRFLASLNYRNHRKIIVVDGQVAFTGGINISDRYFKGDPNLGRWHDMHLAIKGPAVAHMEHVFISDWFMVSEQKIEMRCSPDSARKWEEDTLVQIVPSGPDDVFPTIEQSYLSIINEASEYLYITNPYIIPSAEIIKALQIACLSGVDVRLLVSEKSDSKLVDWTVMSYFEDFLKAGIRIYQFPHGFLHSKIIVSDDEVATVGTANIDVRSFEHNYEVNALIYDKTVAKKLKKNFIMDCAESQEVQRDDILDRPEFQKLKEGLARVFAPLL